MDREDPDTGSREPLSDAAAVTGERRHVTVLFADMAGFTSVSERIGEEATYALMRPVYEMLAVTIRREGGMVKDFTGDGVMALFGVPLALEDATLRACKAALAIQDGLPLATESMAVKYGIRPQMRIGINAGPVVVGQMEGGAAVTALGDTVNLASRLQTLAEPGAVLLSEAAHRLVQGLVESQFGGEYRIKGKRELQGVYRVSRIREGAHRFDTVLSRGLTAYVGRATEMDALRRCLLEAASVVRVVDVVGEPGIGKSRLLHEFRGELDTEQLSVLSGSCSPDGNQTPFLPFIEVVRAAFGLKSGEGEEPLKRRLEQGLTTLGLSSPETIGLMMNLLGLRIPTGSLDGLDGTLIGLRTRDLLQGLLWARCKLGQVVLFLEDIHWIDSGSEELLAKTVASGEKLPLLLVHTRRPEFYLPWTGEAGVTTINLPALSESDTSRLVSDRLQVSLIPEALARLVIEKAEGNPLFAEEITTFLEERGAIVRGEGANVAFDATAVATGLPGGLQSLLTARVDQLDAVDRVLLQTASVVGRVFDPNLVCEAMMAPGQIEERLVAMQALDLVHYNGKSGTYIFKHALVRDALYDSLLSNTRGMLHRRVAEAIEGRVGNRQIEVAEVLARHYSQTDDQGKAFRYLAMAGDKSLGVYSMGEAERYFGEALELLEAAPNCATDQDAGALIAAYIQLLALRAKYSESTKLFAKHQAWLQRLPDQRVHVNALNFVCSALYEQSRFRECEVHALQAAELAASLSDDRSNAYALSALAMIQGILGSRPSAEIEAIAIKAVECSRRTDDAHIQAWSLYAMAWHYLYRGLLQESRRYVGELIAVGEQRKDPRPLGFAEWLLGFLAIIEERYDEAVVHGRRALEISVTAYDTASGQLVEAMGLILSRRIDQGSEALGAFRDLCIARNDNYALMAVEPVFGIAMVLRGKFAKGIKWIEKAIQRADDSGTPATADWARLVLADLYLELLSAKEKPPPLVLLRNFPFLVFKLPAAPKKALQLYRCVLQNEQISDKGILAARAHAGIGFICKRQKQWELATEHLTVAESILAAFDNPTMSEKVQSALGELSAR